VIPIRPAVVAHADWGLHPRKRQVARARLTSVTKPGHRQSYEVYSLAPAPSAEGVPDLLRDLQREAAPGQALLGFDFPIGLTERYAEAAGTGSFTEFLDALGSPPWDQFHLVAEHPDEITLHRPFYPARTVGTKREHLYEGLKLSAQDLRRQCEGTDAEILFWTLGGKQVGKGALKGWQLIADARQRSPGIAIWPFDGRLPDLLDGSERIVVAETYPREFYARIDPPATRWSKRRQSDRLALLPGIVAWADMLGVTWEPAILHRVRAGFSAGANGEDEFDAVIGLLGMIAVVSGTIPTGEPSGPSIATVEGWILGRARRSPDS
jgi:hypothetical protein